MKLIILSCLLLIFSNVYAEVSEILLPHYALRVSIVNENGESLVENNYRHKLKYKNLMVSVKRDKASPTGYFIPPNVCLAAQHLIAMLPKEFMVSLINNVDDLEYYFTIDDPPVDERLLDLNDFLVEIWNLESKDNPLSLHYNEFEPEYIFQKLIRDTNTLLQKSDLNKELIIDCND